MLGREGPRVVGQLAQADAQCVRDIAGFARGLQRAGYATDPTYANKIASIANGPTLGKVL